MKAPIFVWQPNDLLAFSSVEAAQGWVEWQDVDEGTIFDSDGRQLQFDLVEDPRNAAKVKSRVRWFRTLYPPSVRLRPLENVPAHQDDLREALMQAFAAVGKPRDAGLALDELVEQAKSAFLVR